MKYTILKRSLHKSYHFIVANKENKLCYRPEKELLLNQYCKQNYQVGTYL